MRRRLLLSLALLGLLAGPASAQLYADVTLNPGTLRVERTASGAVEFRLIGTRFLGVSWGGLGATSATNGLRAQAYTMPPDTQVNTTRTRLATITVRCGPASCWATVTERGRAGTWRVRPNFTPAVLLKLAAAIEAARLGVGGPWVEVLR